MVVDRADKAPIISPALAESPRGRSTKSRSRVGSVLPNSLRQKASAEFIQPPAPALGCGPDPEDSVCGTGTPGFVSLDIADSSSLLSRMT